ncbi:tRNA (adenosine(37)-N6)-dimethylallyltransferase MiaA [Rhodanobacter sp. FW510-R12]|uniref:tRNA (adenosine(37)-N6)-dimethylallyltransferase MiaA n=1 Tax=unclassified Rhodanobacter TaxID=2621553 RepID=UPI0007AA1F7F|nr:MULTISPECIES: tRNA (adenosine(37)-N6)-dimethylallyltransferase MiaA [unclassified Rhodanobacter]KZC17479.1 tRNA (adenosine(37)-N6)-dimethylallyltransferase MiaA [Rhodanobacter sp. FW104-R8]KZC28434.1 tRNA (adenosine(37)-N6)-dimethylallyltransferase MiaA [Rhodanobacter sp. FW510-T8]KZC32460.1 tRNA (adenosine(37)-N6)-dimethylallyltransferase MiaA [Rhodanobacter sp. FW510-R10]
MPLDTRPLAIFLMGPTASGKTALACELSERFPLDLVSVDSALVYRGMDIGTAKPDPATLARYPHALVDIRDPGQPYSAADFRADALPVMQRISARGRVPLLVGGTGLYFRALQQGLSDLPEADPATRARLAAEAGQLGWPAMHVRLARLDPVAAGRIGCNDVQRLQRALEVIELTGRPLSELQRGGAAMHFPWRVLKLALLPADRQVLHDRIARRFDAMLAEGFLDEVRALRARGDLHADLPAIRAVGYRQAWEHLDGQTDAAGFRDRAIFATRQLAKRQITWLRSEVGARLFDPDQPGLAACGATAVQLFLGQPGLPSLPA